MSAFTFVLSQDPAGAKEPTAWTSEGLWIGSRAWAEELQRSGIVPLSAPLPQVSWHAFVNACLALVEAPDREHLALVDTRHQQFVLGPLTSDQVEALKTSSALSVFGALEVMPFVPTPILGQRTVRVCDHGYRDLPDGKKDWWCWREPFAFVGPLPNEASALTMIEKWRSE